MAERLWEEELGSTPAAALTPAVQGALLSQTGTVRETFLTLYPKHRFPFARGEHPPSGAFPPGMQLSPC